MLCNSSIKKLKDSLKFLLLFCVSFVLLTQSVYAQAPPAVAADSVVLIEASTGQVIYSSNMNTAYPPASTTKVMTALLTLENCDLDEMVTIPKEAVGIEGSKIWILDDEKISVKDMLRALIMESANDVATALAIHIGGSVEGFVEMMNAKAEELGLQNTNFMNPHGLYNSQHKTSAYDLAKIMQEAVKYPEYIEISKTRGYMMPPTSKAPNGRPLWNGNKLILAGSYHYKYAEAGKTGYTVQSQHSYVAAAQKDGMRLIAALVHDNEKRFFKDSVKLFDYGFDNFKIEKIYSKGDEISQISDGVITIPLVAAEDVFLVVPKDFDKAVVKIGDIDTTVGYSADDVVTTAVIQGGSRSVSVDLLAYGNYTPIDLKAKKDNAKLAVSRNISSEDTYSKTPFVITLIILILLLIAVRVYQVNMRKKSRH